MSLHSPYNHVIYKNSTLLLKSSIEIYVQNQAFLWSMDVWGTFCAVCGNQCTGRICLHIGRMLVLHHQDFRIHICSTHTSYYHHQGVVNEHLVHVYCIHCRHDRDHDRHPHHHCHRHHRHYHHSQRIAPHSIHTIKRSAM